MPESGAGFAVVFVIETDRAVMYLRGEADIATAEVLRDAFDHLVQDIKPASVVIDMNDLSFMDVACGHLLADYCRGAARRGCDVTLRRATRPILPILDLFDLQAITA
ncbi:MAG: STAS domain-containing protein [Acidimicrobiaceae bacterium]|nr:STAS domain-containing protein [Acidimicrobiaceae bacterium]MBO0747352.1 STAS domain-containing protein [Acidimicrobiaceae bacterium]